MILLRVRRVLRHLWNKFRPNNAHMTEAIQKNRPPAGMPTSHHHHITCRTKRRKIEEQVKVVRMFTVIQKEHEREERREVINRSRKSCNIMRHVAKEYLARLIHIAKRYSFHATMHLPAPLRLGLSRTGGFTTKEVRPILLSEKKPSRTNCANGLVKHGLEPLLRKGGTFQVLDGSNIPGHCHALRVLNWCHAPKCRFRYISNR